METFTGIVIVLMCAVALLFMANNKMEEEGCIYQGQKILCIKK